MEGKKKCGVSLTAYTHFDEIGYFVIMGVDCMEGKDRGYYREGIDKGDYRGGEEPNGCLIAIGVVVVTIMLLLFGLWASCGFPGVT